MMMFNWKHFILALSALKVCSTAALSSKNPNQTTINIPNAENSQVLLNDMFGYSIEPTSIVAYTKSQIAYNVFEAIESIIGISPPVRIGGTSSDEIRFAKSVNNSEGLQSIAPDKESGNNPIYQITPEWYSIWNNYFPNSTWFIYTVNFGNTTDNWEIAKNQTKFVLDSLRSKLHRFELGNEIDHYISFGWRKQGWDVKKYVEQYKNLTFQMESESEFYNRKNLPKFQAGVIADPPEVPSQQVENDDFSIVNLTTKGHLTNQNHSISSYSVHLYPQSTCDSDRASRLSLDLLVNHSVLYKNVSQYIPEQKAAQKAGAPLVFGETNSASCGGKSGISDTFGAALWTFDYALMAASLNIPEIFFHLGDQSEYSAITPLSYEYKSENLTAGIRANLYGHLMVAHTLKGLNGRGTIKALLDANTSSLSGYSIYDQSKNLKKIVVLNMGVWNSSQGISNPSTLSNTDSNSVSKGQRPKRIFNINTSWKVNQNVQIIRLQAPGTNAKSLVNVSGQTFNSQTGKIKSSLNPENIKVGKNGSVSVTINQAEAVLLSI